MKDYNKISEKYKLSAREYFEILKLSLFHYYGVFYNTSSEVVKADKDKKVWKCACRIADAIYQNKVKEKIMKPTTIKQLLKEFDYDKNSFEDTLDFLIFITDQMIKIQQNK